MPQGDADREAVMIELGRGAFFPFFFPSYLLKSAVLSLLHFKYRFLSFLNISLRVFSFLFLSLFL